METTGSLSILRVNVVYASVAEVGQLSEHLTVIVKEYVEPEVHLPAMLLEVELDGRVVIKEAVGLAVTV